MPNISDVYADNITAHSIDLMRVEGDVRRRVLGHLQKLQDNLIKKISAIDPTGPLADSFKLKRMERLLQQTKATMKTAYKGARTELRSQLTELADVESAFTKNSLNTVLQADFNTVALPKSVTKKIVTGSLIQGAPSSAWWGRQFETTQNLFEDQMRQGLLAGDTLGDLIRRVRGKATGKRETLIVNGKKKIVSEFSGGIMDTSTKNAEALVRTSVQKVANTARLETFKENNDIIKGVQAHVTFDTRTTDICISRSGGAWDINTGEPLEQSAIQEDFPGEPPWHWNSLAKGTLITTNKGQIPIEDIRIGVFVLTHKGRYRKVSAIMDKINDTKNINRFTTESGGLLFATDEHPILIFSKGWLSANDIKVGDRLFEHKIGSNFNTPSIIEIVKVRYTETVYNLSVEEDESYIANNFIVHNCRTTLLPITKTWDELGVKTKGKLKEVPKSTRASMDGQVSSVQTYQQWLKKQSKARQLEVLGPTKAALFRSGKLDLRNLIDHQLGKPKTVATLRKEVLGTPPVPVRRVIPKRNLATANINTSFAKSVDSDRKFFYDSEGLGFSELNAMEKQYSKVIEKSVPSIRVPQEILPTVLKEKRFKSQFESGDSSGLLDFDYRAAAEQQLFGLKENIKPKQRPIYGYLDDGKQHLNEDLDNYGSVTVKLKSEVKERTTFTAGDSLMNYESGKISPSKLTKPSLNSVTPKTVRDNFFNKSIGELENLDDFHDAYTEIQVHGGLTVDDISEVIFTDPLHLVDAPPLFDKNQWLSIVRMRTERMKESMKKLNELGIKNSWEPKIE